MEMNSDHTDARELVGLLASGEALDIDLGDFVRIAGRAVNDPEAIIGASPGRYDANEMFHGLVEGRVAHDLDRLNARVSEGFARMAGAVHGSAIDGIMEATGVSPEEYDRAAEARAEGDPSPLLALQVRYLSTF